MSHVVKRALATSRQAAPFPTLSSILHTRQDSDSNATPELLPSQDDMRLVLSIDITLLTILAAMAFMLLPRVMARFAYPDAWRLGHSFRARDTSRQGLPPAYEVKGDGDIDYPQKPPTAPAWVPRHCQTWTSIIPELGFVLQYRISRGISVGQALVVIGYAMVLGIPSLIHSNPVKNPVRTGIVAVSQVPVVFALACKNNLIGTLLGKGYEQVNGMHRVVGRMLILYADVHSLGYSEFIVSHDTAPINIVL